MTDPDRVQIWDPSCPGLHGRFGSIIESTPHETFRVRLDAVGDKPSLIAMFGKAQVKRPGDWGRGLELKGRA